MSAAPALPEKPKGKRPLGLNVIKESGAGSSGAGANLAKARSERD